MLTFMQFLETKSFHSNRRIHDRLKQAQNQYPLIITDALIEQVKQNYDNVEKIYEKPPQKYDSFAIMLYPRLPQMVCTKIKAAQALQLSKQELLDNEISYGDYMLVIARNGDTTTFEFSPNFDKISHGVNNLVTYEELKKEIRRFTQEEKRQQNLKGGIKI